MALLQEEVPSWTEIAGSRDPVPSLSSAPKPDCRIPQLRSLASHPAHLSFQYLASPTAPPVRRAAYPGCRGQPEAEQDLCSRRPGGRRRALRRRAGKLRRRPQARCRIRAAPQACLWRCCCGPPDPGRSAYWTGCARAEAEGPGPATGSAVGLGSEYQDPVSGGGVRPGEEVKQGESAGRVEGARPKKVEFEWAWPGEESLAEGVK